VAASPKVVTPASLPTTSPPIIVAPAPSAKPRATSHSAKVLVSSQPTPVPVSSPPAPVLTTALVVTPTLTPYLYVKWQHSELDPGSFLDCQSTGTIKDAHNCMSIM